MHLEPNKIHHLPGTSPYNLATAHADDPIVRVTYTLPSPPPSPSPFFSTGYAPLTLPVTEESKYTTSCEGLVPVFVHDVQERRRKVKTEDGVGNEEERVASVCLKSLVKAMCLSRYVFKPHDIIVADPTLLVVPRSSHQAAHRTSKSTHVANPPLPLRAAPSSTPRHIQDPHRAYRPLEAAHHPSHRHSTRPRNHGIRPLPREKRPTLSRHRHTSRTASRLHQHRHRRTSFNRNLRSLPSSLNRERERRR